MLHSSALAARALPRRSLAAAPRSRRATCARRPRASGANGSNGNGSAPPQPPPPKESWWQKVVRDLDLGPAGFEDGSASSVMGAMDFGEASSAEEAEALAAAREYVGPETPMTPEQSAALKKRIGGSYRGFFKEWVEPKGDAVDEGIVFYDKVRSRGAQRRARRGHSQLLQRCGADGAARLLPARAGDGQRLLHQLGGVLAGAAACPAGGGRRAGCGGGANVNTPLGDVADDSAHALPGRVNPAHKARGPAAALAPRLRASAAPLSRGRLAVITTWLFGHAVPLQTLQKNMPFTRMTPERPRARLGARTRCAAAASATTHSLCAPPRRRAAGFR